ncbi:MAG: aminotransferase class IV [Phycisphaerales bacterium]|nr:aminotransferase class IV [Phycisphaerales bacterium]
MSSAPGERWVALNGVLTPAGEARVSVFDAGFLQGIGLFETLKVRTGRPLRLEQHLGRMAASAQNLGWSVLPDARRLAGDVGEVLTACGLRDARVRITVTAGSLLAAGGGDTPALTTLVTAAPEELYDKAHYQSGVTAVISPSWQTIDDPTMGHKTTSYFSRLAALRGAHRQGAFEALWLTPDGELAEGCISNVFIVDDEHVLTPPVDTPVLPGIARAAVFELCAALGLTCHEATLSLDDLRAADEVFLTNSLMDVMPVVRVARLAIGNERPGEITRQLMAAYAELVERECGGS